MGRLAIGISFANLAPFDTAEGARAIARAAEAAGVESLWTVEHVVIPQAYASQYPYSRSGRMGGDERSSIPDPLVWLAYVGALTSRLRLATGILILPQRNPVILAKEVATLDVLTGGRLILGVGIGWLREEFEALGIPFADRARRTEEAMAALRALWSDEETHEGERFRFHQARSYPKPVRPAGIPLVVGGHTMAAARRAGRLADGFFPAGKDTEVLIEECRRTARGLGRDPESIEITVSGNPDLEQAERLRALGVRRIVVRSPTRDLADVDRAFAALGDDFISRLA
jgi:probable F420-dependent oxidoreductase